MKAHRLLDIIAVELLYYKHPFGPKHVLSLILECSLTMVPPKCNSYCGDVRAPSCPPSCENTPLFILDRSLRLDALQKCGGECFSD